MLTDAHRCSQMRPLSASSLYTTRTNIVLVPRPQFMSAAMVPHASDRPGARIRTRSQTAIYLVSPTTVWLAILVDVVCCRSTTSTDDPHADLLPITHGLPVALCSLISTARYTVGQDYICIFFRSYGKNPCVYISLSARFGSSEASVSAGTFVILYKQTVYKVWTALGHTYS